MKAWGNFEASFHFLSGAFSLQLTYSLASTTSYFANSFYSFKS